MKRIFQHPPEPLTGKHYWRSLGELSDTPEFRKWLEREFPAGVAELNGAEWSRRDFLKLMGASMALAGFGLNGCRRPEAHLVPFTKNVGGKIPGKFLYYAPPMPRAPAHRRDSTYREDCGRTPDQARRQSIASGEWRSDRHFRPGVDS